MKILIVDDQEFVGEPFKEWIEAIFGISCDYISSPKKALNAIPEGNYFLVFSDLQMPEMDGFEFQEEVNRRFPDLPFALVSGRADQTGKIQAECDQRNIFFLRKPVNEEEVAAVILMAKMPHSFPTNL